MNQQEKDMYRKGVSALIVNVNVEFLLVNLNSFEEKYFAVPGGGVEDGETLENAVYREIQEELSISKESLEYVGKSEKALLTVFKEPKISRNGKTYVGSERHFFGLRFIGNSDTIKLQESEVRNYRWVSFAELPNYLLFDNQLKDMQDKIEEIFRGIHNKKLNNNNHS